MPPFAAGRPPFVPIRQLSARARVQTARHEARRDALFASSFTGSYRGLICATDLTDLPPDGRRLSAGNTIVRQGVPNLTRAVMASYSACYFDIQPWYDNTA